MLRPTVSIVVPVFNREEFLAETIESIIAQEFSNWELLLIDDGSNDSSIEIANSFEVKDERIHVFKRDREPKGAPTCRNIGFELSKGIFIQYFDSDDLMFPETILEKVAVLEKDRSLDFVVSRTEYLRKDGTVLKPDQRLNYPANFGDYLRNNTLFLTPGPLFRRSFLETDEIGFDPKLRRHQDFEFFCRLMSKSPSFYVIDNYHHQYRMHDGSIMTRFKSKGNLGNLLTKLKALNHFNRNTYYEFHNDVRKVYSTMIKTALKVAIYQLNLRVTVETIYRGLLLYTPIIIKPRVKREKR